MQATVEYRKTKYCLAIEAVLADVGHATNAQLLAELQKNYPNLSATTVHRATSRLAARGLIAMAPSSRDGSMRYDTNIELHDHFICSTCEAIKDADVKDTITQIMESSIDDCRISGRLTIGGICKKCIKGDLK